MSDSHIQAQTSALLELIIEDPFFYQFKKPLSNTDILLCIISKMPKMIRYSFHRFLDDYYDNETHDFIYEKNVFDIKQIYMIIPYAWNCIYNTNPPTSLIVHCLSKCIPIYKFMWCYSNDIPYMRFMNDLPSYKELMLITNACNANPLFPYNLEEKDLLCYTKISNEDICKKIDEWSIQDFSINNVETYLHDYIITNYVDQSVVNKIHDFYVKFYDKTHDYYRFMIEKLVLPQTIIIYNFNKSNEREKYLIDTIKSQWISEELSNDWNYKFSFWVAQSLLRFVKLNNFTLEKCLSLVDQSMLSRFTYSPQILDQTQITTILTKCVEDIIPWVIGNTPFTIRTKFNKQNMKTFQSLRIEHEEDECKQMFYLNYSIDSPIRVCLEFLNSDYVYDYCDMIVDYWFTQNPRINNFKNRFIRICNQRIIDTLYVKMLEKGIAEKNETILKICKEIITKINISESVFLNSIKQLKLCSLPNPNNEMFKVNKSLLNQLMKLKKIHITKKPFIVNCIINDKIDESVLKHKEFSPELWKHIQINHRRYSARFLSLGKDHIDFEDAQSRIHAYYAICKVEVLNDDTKNIIMQYV